MRSLLDDRASSERLRAAVHTEEGHDPGLWRTVAELGLLGILVPEEYGGGGGELADMAVVLHELGRRAVPLPVLSTAVLAPTALLMGMNHALATELLPALASGQGRAAVAIGGPEGQLDPRTWTLTWRDCGLGYRLDGAAGYVLDAPGADIFVVSARAAEGLLVAVVDAAHAKVTAAPTTDMTRRVGTITLDGAVVGPERVIAARGAADDVIAAVRETAAWAVAADAVGLAERTTEQTATYARERRQFGRAIGSFQAIKHTCADMAVSVECSRAAVDTALRALTVGGSAPAVSIAKSYACDAAVSVCADAIQVHGGIGFTWEHDAHIWLKRALLDRALFGSSSWHRRRVADTILPATSVAGQTSR